MENNPSMRKGGASILSSVLASVNIILHFVVNVLIVNNLTLLHHGSWIR